MSATVDAVSIARRGLRRRRRRLGLIGMAAVVLALALTLILVAMRDSIVFFHGPTEIAEKGIAPGSRIRLGGLVEQGSVRRGPNQEVSFAVTDGKTRVVVGFTGLLPDLFREGQGVVTEGMLIEPGRFKAETVLAKHDETYMPREVADALKKQGHWQPADGAKPAR